jgi:hypothetical protein
MLLLYARSIPGAHFFYNFSGGRKREIRFSKENKHNFRAVFTQKNNLPCHQNKVAFMEWPKRLCMTTSWSRIHVLQVCEQIAHPRQLHRPTWHFSLIKSMHLANQSMFHEHSLVGWRAEASATLEPALLTTPLPHGLTAAARYTGCIDLILADGRGKTRYRRSRWQKKY